MMQFIPTGRQFVQFGAIALLTIFLVNRVMMVRNIVKPNP